MRDISTKNFRPRDATVFPPKTKYNLGVDSLATLADAEKFLWEGNLQLSAQRS